MWIEPAGEAPTEVLLTTLMVYDSDFFIPVTIAFKTSPTSMIVSACRLETAVMVLLMIIPFFSRAGMS